MLVTLNKATKLVLGSPPVIGSAFQGPAMFLDTINGVTWHTMPKMSPVEERLQQALLRKKK